ncbi:MAG: histidinol-phosphate aminotransferase [Clostridiales bacterium]|nr:histidinol-phosphate aminotransferase [Clostridiales bacterium]
MESWKRNVREVEPYVPGEQPNIKGMIKLNTNENPYPPAPMVEEMEKKMDTNLFRLYPDPTADRLVSALASRYGLEKDQVFVGVGSDDVLALSFLTFFNAKEPILFPDITYSFYDVWANLYRIPFETPALDDNFKIRVSDYKKKNGGIVIANPNAPTSICEELSFIREILDCNRDVVVIVDEAYIDFGGESAVSLIPEYDNLLVVQTFSKSRSMAGMRIGYAMGNQALIGALLNVKYSFNSYTMNLPSILLGEQVIFDEAYFKETTDKIIKTREWTKLALSELGFTFPDSKTNFLFVTHPSILAGELFRMLREKNIFVRHFNKPRIDNYLRISIGTDQEMETLIKTLKEYVR